MNSLFPDKLWNFKNFSLGTELDIAGEFIYDGIHTFNQTETIDQDSLIFSFLYHISVGIERLQKIVLILLDDFNAENYEEFEKKLITHNHVELNRKICANSELKLNSRENEFLQLIAGFYKSARYHRFNFESQYYGERQMLSDFIINNIAADKIEYHFMTKYIVINSDVKNLLGKVIGTISKKYYDLVYSGSSKNNTYTYELRTGSKAEKIFLNNYKNVSLQQQKINEMIVSKELLVYLMNTKYSNSFFRYLKDIQPLDLDIGLVNSYISDLTYGIVSQTLIDEVEFQYEENSYSIERIELINAIGNTNIMFEFKDIKECFDLVKCYIGSNYDSREFVIKFVELYELVDDWDIPDVLISIYKKCDEYISGDWDDTSFLQEIKKEYVDIETVYNFESE